MKFPVNIWGNRKLKTCRLPLPFFQLFLHFISYFDKMKVYVARRSQMFSTSVFACVIISIVCLKLVSLVTMVDFGCMGLSRCHFYCVTTLQHFLSFNIAFSVALNSTKLFCESLKACINVP